MLLTASAASMFAFRYVLLKFPPYPLMNSFCSASHMKRRRERLTLRNNRLRLQARERWVYLTDMPTDHQRVCGQNHQSYSPIQDEGNDQGGYDHSDVLQEDCGTIHHDGPQQSGIRLKARRQHRAGVAHVVEPTDLVP